MNSLTIGQPLLQPLCDRQGRLNPAAIGRFSRARTHCHIPGHVGRRKRWNHWCITTPEWILSMTMVDFDYLSYGSIHFLDLSSGQSSFHSQRRLLARHCLLPETPRQDHFFKHPQLELIAREQGNATVLSATAQTLGALSLAAHFNILWPAHLESVNVVCPLGPKTFNASCRQLSLPVSGSIKIGHHIYHCPSGRSFASLDFARGVWPWHSHWQRAAFAAPGGIAGNFGTIWDKQMGQSENALLFAGKVIPLPSAFSITLDNSLEEKRWHLSSACARVDLTFTPLHLHHAKPRIGPIFADTKQYFGHYDGTLINPSGEQVPLKKVVGWFGETHARW